jgi:hypothetical protein
VYVLCFVVTCLLSLIQHVFVLCLIFFLFSTSSRCDMQLQVVFLHFTFANTTCACSSPSHINISNITSYESLPSNPNSLLLAVHNSQLFHFNFLLPLPWNFPFQTRVNLVLMKFVLLLNTLQDIIVTITLYNDNMRPYAHLLVLMWIIEAFFSWWILNFKLLELFF